MVASTQAGGTTFCIRVFVMFTHSILMKIHKAPRSMRNQFSHFSEKKLFLVQGSGHHPVITESPTLQEPFPKLPIFIPLQMV
jgi:hypothetical protein